MVRAAEDGSQTDESVFSVFCFGRNDQVTAVRAYRVKVARGGPKGYKGVVLDISPDLPIQQKMMRVYECDGDNRTRIEIDVIQEIRSRHPDLVVRRNPPQPGSGDPHDTPTVPLPSPTVPPAPAAKSPPREPAPAKSDSPLPVPMSLKEACRTVTAIANDESNSLPVQDSVRNLAKVLATVLSLITQEIDESAAT